MLVTNPQELHHMALDDGGATPAHPGNPPPLPTSTDADTLAAWHREMDHYRAKLEAYRVSLEPDRIEAADKHAKAQADTAVAMDKYADAMRDFMTPVAPAPSPAPSPSPEPSPEPADIDPLLADAVVSLGAYFASVRS